jgi:hypothetical protein
VLGSTNVPRVSPRNERPQPSTAKKTAGSGPATALKAPPLPSKGAARAAATLERCVRARPRKAHVPPSSRCRRCRLGLQRSRGTVSPGGALLDANWSEGRDVESEKRSRWACSACRRSWWAASCCGGTIGCHISRRFCAVSWTPTRSCSRESWRVHPGWSGGGHAERCASVLASALCLGASQRAVPRC